MTKAVFEINVPILAFSVALALLCGIVFGLVPALRLSRRDSARMLSGRQTGVVAAPAKHRWSVLIAAQVALTLLFMATASTAIRSFLALMRTQLGYDPANVMRLGIIPHAHVTTPGEKESIPSRQARVAYIEQIRDTIASVLFGVFSAMALALALVGIFSLVAYSMAQRTTEFGVRLALGAPRKHVLWVAARIALVSAAVGIAAGLALDSFLGAVLAHSMQNSFAARSLLAAAALLALSAFLACLLPARHAVAVSPTEALRYE